MRIYKIHCDKCQAKFTVHHKLVFNKAYRIDYAMSQLLIDDLLLLSINKDGIVRTKCDSIINGKVCNGHLIGYYIKVKKRKSKDGKSSKNKI